MQTKYTPKMSLRNKIVTGVAVGLTAFGSLFNGGCGPNRESRLETYKELYSKTDSGKLELCNCNYIIGTYSLRGPIGDILRIDMYNEYSQETNPENLKYMDEMCKQGIISYGETPTENLREQGKGILQKIKSPIVNLYYDGQFLFFTKSGYPARFTVQLNNLTAYEHIKDDKWIYSPMMTKWAREGQAVYAAIDQMKAQEQARNNQNNKLSQAERDANVIDDMKGRFGGNMATMGLLQAIADHSK